MRLLVSHRKRPFNGLLEKRQTIGNPPGEDIGVAEERGHSEEPRRDVPCFSDGAATFEKADGRPRLANRGRPRPTRCALSRTSARCGRPRPPSSRETPRSRPPACRGG